MNIYPYIIEKGLSDKGSDEGLDFSSQMQGDWDVRVIIDYIARAIRVDWFNKRKHVGKASVDFEDVINDSKDGTYYFGSKDFPRYRWISLQDFSEGIVVNNELYPYEKLRENTEKLKGR